MKCGSLFSGIGGLDMAVCEFFDAELAWVCETEKGPAKVLDQFNVPNLGDITKVNWEEVEPVDIICGGYPCQPFSQAGKRKGFDDDRDLWPHFARAVGVLRPRFVYLENVKGHLRLGFHRTLGDLARMGFDAEWGVVRASDAKAPHRRERLFCLAWRERETIPHPDRSGHLHREPRLEPAIGGVGSIRSTAWRERVANT